jgi:phosphoribosylamine--glycine ligase
MKVLILGSGGREHAFAWKISQSPLCSELYAAPGNPGTASVATNVALDILDFDILALWLKTNQIELLVVGPEVPLVEGVRDFLEADPDLANLAIVGPGKAGAMLEGSKDFSKDFMAKHGVPTAASKTFTSAQLEEGLAYLDQHDLPIVLKADGLAAGKGVIISETHEHAKETLREMLIDLKFGDASSKVVVEQFLEGIEVSVFVLTDGTDYVILPEAKDYKRIGEKDTGLNTGGMGAVSPVHFADDVFLRKVEERIVKPTIAGLQTDGIPYCGFIFIGLMNMKGEPFTIEYNVRMGDPETQVVLPRVKSDFLELLAAAGQKRLGEISYEADPQFATTVVAVSGGYPVSYAKGKVISGMDSQGAQIFQAGTKTVGDQIVTNGGRVLAFTGRGETLEAALKQSYDTLSKVSWEGMYFRSDIGQDLK